MAENIESPSETGIPRPLLFTLLEKLHPFEIEKLEVSGVFQSMGIDTNPLWRDMYTSRWPRKRKWPKLCFKMKGMKPKQEQWRVYYLQRHLQDAINQCKTTENCSPSPGTTP